MRRRRTCHVRCTPDRHCAPGPEQTQHLHREVQLCGSFSSRRFTTRHCRRLSRAARTRSRRYGTQLSVCGGAGSGPCPATITCVTIGGRCSQKFYTDAGKPRVSHHEWFTCPPRSGLVVRLSSHTFVWLRPGGAAPWQSTTRPPTEAAIQAARASMEAPNQCQPGRRRERLSLQCPNVTLADSACASCDSGIRSICRGTVFTSVCVCVSVCVSVCVCQCMFFGCRHV